MYWWNIKALKELLARGPLPQAIAFRYLAIYMTCSALLTLPGTQSGQWDIGFFASSAALNLLGTIYCYHQNGAARGAHLVDRLLSLGFVVTLRLFPLIFVVGYLVRKAEGHVGDVDHPRTLAEALVGVGALIIYYWRLGAHTRDVRKRAVEAAVSEP